MKADIAIASKTVTLSSLEILDDFQNVSMKIKVLKVKDQVEFGGNNETGSARHEILHSMEYCLRT